MVCPMCTAPQMKGLHNKVKCRPEELPEVVLGAARVYRTDFMEPRPFPARLTRTSTDMPDMAM